MPTFDQIPEVMAAGYSTRHNNAFADPFADYASLSMPTAIYDSHRWCQHILLANNTYNRALRRVASYFVTSLEVSGDDVDTEEITKYREFVNELLCVPLHTMTVLLDWLCYGNAFFSVLQKFRRYLACPCGQLELPLAQVYNDPQYNFRWRDCRPYAVCPKCHFSGEFRHIDRRSKDPGDVFIRRWNPFDIELIPEPHTDTNVYVWQIPASEREDIKRGVSLHLLENTPWEVIEAVRRNEKLCFDRDMLLHLRSSTFAGIRTHGWGMSQVLVNFRQAWLVQVMRRYNEALALEDIVPFRLLTPEVRSGADQAGADPILGTDLSAFSSEILSLIGRHRLDPAGWHSSPYPVRYQTLGGDASQFAPKDLMDQADDVLLNGIGVPVELYRGSITAQAAPVGIRLFESQWFDLVAARDMMLRYITRKVTSLLSWEPVTIRWRPVTIIDDADKQAAKLQLMLAKQVSRTSGQADLGLDPKTEDKLMIEEEKTVAELQNAAKKEQEAMLAAETLVTGTDQAAAPAGPGMMSMPQPNTPVTLEELHQQAQQMAQQYATMPDSSKRSALIQLRKTNPVLGPLVSDMVSQLDEQRKLQGGEMLKQQQQQKMAGYGLLTLLRKRGLTTGNNGHGNWHHYSAKEGSEDR